MGNIAGSFRQGEGEFRLTKRQVPREQDFAEANGTKCLPMVLL